MSDVEKELMKAHGLLNDGEFEKALKAYKNVVKADPKNFEGHFGIASAMELNPKSSIEDISMHYEEALKYGPDDITVLTSYGAFCLDAGKYEKAEQCFMKAAEIDEDNDYKYICDFAVEYAKKAPLDLEKYETPQTKDLVEKKKDEIYVKALGLILNSISVSPERGLKIIEQIKSK